MNVNFASVATIPLPENTEAVIIRPGPDQRFSDEEFAQFCAQYPELRIEMSSEGEMIIMLPVVSAGGKRNFKLTGRFFIWVEADGTGVGFDSSTGFALPNGAKLGWLIDPLEKKVHIYRPGAPVEVLDNPPEISGDPLLKGFVLKLDGILS